MEKEIGQGRGQIHTALDGEEVIGYFAVRLQTGRVTPRREWTQAFMPLGRLSAKVEAGGVVCLCPAPLPLDQKGRAIPVGLI